ncbi:hypothetical protein HYW76_02035 [Candidatus Pacearchaeota archaeon]|nr:hypothetical protein [Candidatus Pacearchaeota archaeon]
MAIINFQCKKCRNEFDCETGKITFGNILDFEKDIICSKCGKLNKENIWLTELGQTQIGEIFFSESKLLKEHNVEFDIEEKSILSLCDEVGTGFDAINEANESSFYPILFTIEETIYLHYKKDLSLDDSQIIASLKNLRDNILSEKKDYNSLEHAIIDRIKIVIHFNSYSKRDVLLSISKVLNSVKLHKYMGGKRGYLKFIAEYVDISEGGYELHV